MKALTAVITALSVPLFILNMLGAIVSGIWLAVLGEWRPIGFGILSFFVSSFLLGFALMPGLLLAAPAAWLAEKGKILGVVFFGTLSNLYTVVLVTVWCCGVLYFFVKDASDSTLIPRLIWSYGVATGPWSYFASKEQGEGSEGFASFVAVFFAQLAYLVIMLLVLFTPITLLAAAEVFGAFMLVGLIVQITVAVMVMLEEKRIAKMRAEYDIC
jgi:hypothetical protein